MSTDRPSTDLSSPPVSRSRRRAAGALLALACAALAAPAAFAANFSSDRITVSAQGEGSDVILIPGLNSSPRVWAQLIKAVPGHRYHQVHIAGFAGRPKGGNAEGAVAAPVTDEIARYIAASSLRQPAVIGHSMGGTIGLMLAARHPEAVSRLMVVDMVPFMGALFGPPGTTAQSVKPTADAIEAQMRGADPALRQQRAQATIDGMVQNVVMRAGGIEDSVTSDIDVSVRSFHELLVTDLGPELASIKARTTVLYVTSKSVPLTDLQVDGAYKAVYAPLKGVQLKRIPDSAHFIMWDQPERFHGEVKAFLD